MLLKTVAVKYRRDGLASTLATGLGIANRQLSSLLEAIRRTGAVHRGRYRVAVDSTTTEFHASRGEWGKLYQNVNTERVVYRDLLSSLRSDDVFYDIGANIGTYTCIVGTQLESGTVVAFEPHPANAIRIKENALMNQVSPDVRQIALSNQDETFDLALQSAAVGTGLHDLSNASPPYSVLPVEARHGDTYVTEEALPLPDIVKIDVEGFELAVLDGLSETLAESDCRLIYCEAHSHHLPAENTVDDVVDVLTSAGYTVTELQTRHSSVHLKATK